MPDHTGSNVTTSSTVPAGAAVTVIDTRVAASRDDVEERASGRMYLTSSDLEMLLDRHSVQTVGLRFTDVQIPAGAVIVNAYIQFEVDEAGSRDTFIEIRGLASDDLAPFTASHFDLTSRNVTAASASWSPGAWLIVNENGPDQQSPDLAAIVQEIIERDGWQAGNDLGFSLSGTGKRVADSFDGDAGAAPLLHVEYYIPQASTLDIDFAPDPDFRENVAGAVVGTLSLAAPEAGQSYTLSVSDDRFQLVGMKLQLRSDLRLDFERDPWVSVQVTAMDASGLAYSETIFASVGDVPETRFAAFGDYGSRSGSAEVARLVDALGVDLIVTLGDNSYGSDPIDQQIGANYSGYIGDYNGAFGEGSTINRFYPALGNHEYDGDGGGVTAYLDYFTLPGNERYYDFVVGPVHFFALNSNPEEPDGRSATSTQAEWLKAQLASSTSLYNIVYFHHAPFSSGATHGSTQIMQWPFEDWGATAALSGHDHDYERILRDDNGDGGALAYFVAGLGGAERYGFDSPVSGSVFRYNEDYGTMLIQASDESITFEFIAANGGPAGTIIDSFTIDLPILDAASATADAMPAEVALTNPILPLDPIVTLAPGQIDVLV